jgi:putative ABC transport system ATP-binding protein
MPNPVLFIAGGEMIRIENLVKNYRLGDETVHALDVANLDITDGEFVAIIGPSGSGKSTMLHLIGGLDTPSSGKIIVDGRDLSRASDRELARYRNSKVGFIFQTFNLHPTYSALENVSIPLLFSHLYRANRKKRAAAALEAVGMSHRAKHRPNQLSGGERQRVAIARALVTNPVIIVADEPTGNLDSVNGANIMELLKNMNREKGITLLIATHDPEIAGRAGRVITMKDGKIISDERK